MLDKREKKIRRAFNLTPKTISTLDNFSSERRINKSEIVETALVNLFLQVNAEINITEDMIILLNELSKKFNLDNKTELIEKALKNFLTNEEKL